MNLNELYAEVSRHADTAGTTLNAADVSRVCASLFSVLAKLPIDAGLAILAKGVEVATAKDN